MSPQLAQPQLTTTDRPKRIFQSLWTASFVFLSSFLAYGYSFPQSNIFNQVPVIEALMDRSLFSRDFYIQEMTGFTPRFYYYHLVILFHQWLSLPIAKFALFLLAFGSIIGGLYSIGRHLAKSPFAGVSLAFLALGALDGTLGVTDIFRVEPISAIYAMGITVWGIYFCCRRQWRLGYFMFGLATLLQFLIGFLPACLWGLSLLLETVVLRQNLKGFVGAFLLFSSLVALVYIPMVATGSTSSDVLTDSTFVQLYGYVRHPHHIILSSFPAKEWRDFLLLSLSGFLILQLSDRLTTGHKRDLALTLIITGCMLLIGYLFVESVPVALIAKLQFARSTPFAMLTVWIALSVVASEYHQRRNYPVSLLLIVMPLVDKVGPILLLVFVSLLLFAKTASGKPTQSNKATLLTPFVRLHNISLHRQKDINTTYALFFLALLACWSFLPTLYASLAYPLLQQSFPKGFERSRPYIKATVIGFVLYIFLHLSGIIGNQALTPLHRKVKLYAPPADSLALVATQFQQVSPTDALVLVPPSDEAFRFYAKRSVVATAKSFPFTDQGILIWQSRLENILGPLNAQVMSANYTNERYGQLSGEALMALARDYGADYLLTQAGWHTNLSGQVVASEGEWEVWQLSQNQFE